MRSTYIFAILFSILLLSTAFAQSTERGWIYTLSYAPKEPMVSESLTITVGVENNGNEAYDYKLLVLVTKDGKIKETLEYPFNLKAGRGISFSPTYIPDDIGRFEIIAKLYDKYETKLIDSKIVKFSSLIDIGPFDLSIDVPAKTVRPGQTAPTILTLENMGEKGTDVEVRVEMNCINQQDIVKTFFIFLEAKSAKDKMVTLPTCNEVGIHEISAQIILFNKSWTSSMSQILLNESYIELFFQPLSTFKIKAGESKVFDLSVKNFGNMKINNLKVLIEGIPLSWVKITPESIIETGPNQTVLFLINISVPDDIKLQKYPITIAAAADQTLQKEDSMLEITSLAIQKTEGGGPTFVFPSIISSIMSNLTTIIISIGVGISAILLFRFRDRIFFRSTYSARRNTLSKIKATIEKIHKKND